MHDLLLADDCALFASTEVEMPRSVDLLAKPSTNFSPTISIKKTEVMPMYAPGTPRTEPIITHNGKRLNTVNRFAYFGSTLSQAVHIDDKIDTRIARASTIFGRFRQNIWERRGIRVSTKLKPRSRGLPHETVKD